MNKANTQVHLHLFILFALFYLFEFSKISMPVLIGMDLGYIHPKQLYTKSDFHLAADVINAFNIFVLIGLVSFSLFLALFKFVPVSRTYIQQLDRHTLLISETKEDQYRFMSLCFVIFCITAFFLNFDKLYFSQPIKQLNMISLFCFLFIASQQKIKPFLIALTIGLILVLFKESRFWFFATTFSAVIFCFAHRPLNIKNLLIFLLTLTLIIGSADFVRRTVAALRTGIPNVESVKQKYETGKKISPMDIILIEKYGNTLRPFADLYTSRLNLITSIKIADQIDGYTRKVEGDIKRSFCLLPVWLVPCKFNVDNETNTKKGFSAILDKEDKTTSISVGISGSAYFLFDRLSYLAFVGSMYAIFFYLIFHFLYQGNWWISYFLYFSISARESFASLVPFTLHIFIGFVLFFSIVKFHNLSVRRFL